MGERKVRVDSGLPAEPVLERHEVRAEIGFLSAAEEVGERKVRVDSGLPAEPVLERHEVRAEVCFLSAAEKMGERTVRIRRRPVFGRTAVSFLFDSGTRPSETEATAFDRPQRFRGHQLSIDDKAFRSAMSRGSNGSEVPIRLVT
jgi:hypothetical protein